MKSNSKLLTIIAGIIAVLLIVVAITVSVYNTSKLKEAADAAQAKLDEMFVGLKEGNDDIIFEYIGLESGSATTEILKIFLSNLDYKVVDTTIETNKVTFKTEITNVDLNEATQLFKNKLAEYVTQIITEKGKDISSNDIVKDLFKKIFDEKEVNMVKTTVNIVVSRDSNGNWFITDTNQKELGNAILPNSNSVTQVTQENQ